MVSEQFAHWLYMEPGSRKVVFGELAERIATAIWGNPEFISFGDRLAHEVARVNAEPELLNAVRTGELRVCDPLTLGPHPFPVGDALQRSVVLLTTLKDYLAKRDIGVRVVPQFVTKARPTPDLDPELLSLEPSDRLSYIENYGSHSSAGQLAAADYIATIRERIARQADGFFTVDEAAQVLADENPHLNARAMAGRLKLATVDGRTILRSSDDQLWVTNPRIALAVLSLVKASDIDAWLVGEGVGYRFPPAAGISVPAAPPPIQTAPAIGAVPRFTAQERAVLDFLAECKINPRALPDRAAGKPGIKAKARKALQGTPLFAGEKIFDKAWERLRNAREIQDRS